jgi:hypothetical protein
MRVPIYLYLTKISLLIANTKGDIASSELFIECHMKVQNLTVIFALKKKSESLPLLL